MICNWRASVSTQAPCLSNTGPFSIRWAHPKRRKPRTRRTRNTVAAAAKPLPMRKVDEQKKTGRSAERRNTRSTTARARSERRRKRTRRRKRVKRRKTRDKSRVWGCPRELFNVSMLPQFGEHIIIKSCRKAKSEKKPKEDWEFACTGLDHIKDIIPFSAKHFSNKKKLG